jgi:hypothetical protein
MILRSSASKRTPAAMVFGFLDMDALYAGAQPA